MHRVGARLEINVDNAARSASVLGVIAIRENLHLADGFHRGSDDERSLIDEIDHVDVVINAVKKEVVLTVGADSVGGEVTPERTTGTILRGKNSGRHASEEAERSLAAERKL